MLGPSLGPFMGGWVLALVSFAWAVGAAEASHASTAATQSAATQSAATQSAATQSAATQSAEERRARQAIADLAVASRSRYPDERARAVRSAAEIGGRAGLDFVLAALGDPLGQVADTAQAELLRFEPARVVDSLLGPAGLGAKDPWTRRRAAESLGEVGGPGVAAALRARALTAGLDRREEEVTWATAVALEHLARAGALTREDRERLASAVSRALGGRCPDALQARLFMALAALDPALARDRDAVLARRPGPELAGALLRRAVDEDGPAGRARLAQALSDERPSLRALALELVGAGHADRALLAEVAARLDAEERVAVRERVPAALRRVTGLGHGAHAKSWVHAIERLPPDWAPAVPSASGEASAGSARADDGPRTVAGVRLGGLEPLSDRLAVLVDFSGSLWNERPDGTRRKDRLDPEVALFLGRLDDDTEFLLVPFTHELHPQTDAPVTATRSRVDAARRDFERARMTGRGDVFAAVELALGFTSIDRIVIVTDGAPTGGRRWDVERITELLLERTRFRPVAFDVVLHDASKSLVRRWRRLAEASGGRLVEVE